MKKSISVLVLLGIVATGVFAQNFSMSVGGGRQNDLGLPLQEGASGFNTVTGSYGFFDSTYVALGMAFGYGVNTDITDGNYRNRSYSDPSMALQFSLLGKYPVDLGLVTLFPMAGARFVLPVWQKEKIPGFDATDLAYMGLQAGVGMDYFFGTMSARWRQARNPSLEGSAENVVQRTSNFFLRSEFLFNIDLKGFGDYYENADTIQSIGPTSRISIGYRF